MTNVADMSLVECFSDIIVFLRFDGTIWMLNAESNSENEVPKKIATFGQTMTGDMNGDNKINMQDCALLRRYLAGWNVTIDESAADVDGNGKLNLMDSALLRRYLAGWNVELK